MRARTLVPFAFLWVGSLGPAALVACGNARPAEEARVAPSSSSTPIASSGIYMQTAPIARGSASAATPLARPPEAPKVVAERNAPAAPTAGAPASAPVSIAAGNNTSCAAFADGTTLCWGSNEFLQLGDGTTDDRSCPGRADVTNATQISIGSAHACARLSDGRVKCWGSNYAGQLGNGAHDNSGSSIPVDTRLEHVTKISASSWTCALLETKKVSCFGDWDDGERTGSFVPRDMGVSGAVDVAAGSPHGCALLGNGSVKCFGRAWSYAVGPATLAMRDVVSIASSNGSCAVKKDGTVQCWGTPVVPQVNSRSDNRAPIAAPLWSDATTLSMGDELACAIRTDGTVLCQEDKKLPAVVPGLSQVVEVSAGRAHACARTRDGRILCWGANDHGQLGDGTKTARPTPAPVAWCH